MSLNIKLWLVVIVVTISAITGIVIKIQRDAAKEALSKVERQNNAAGDTSDRARNDFDLCPDGMWDFRAGKCNRP